jgi:hypothetical protein
MTFKALLADGLGLSQTHHSAFATCIIRSTHLTQNTRGAS